MFDSLSGALGKAWRALAGEKILHAYAEPGDYDVKLGVSDGSGLVCGQAWTDLKVAVRRRE